MNERMRQASEQRIARTEHFKTYEWNRWGHVPFKGVRRYWVRPSFTPRGGNLLRHPICYFFHRRHWWLEWKEFEQYEPGPYSPGHAFDKDEYGAKIHYGCCEKCGRIWDARPSGEFA